MRQISTWTVITVVLISIFFLPSLRGVIVLGMSVLMIFTQLMASLQWMGYKLNPLSAVFVLLAVGLSVDYSAHIVHAFYSDENAVPGEENTPFAPVSFGSNEAVKLRMERALFAMGPNVILGGMTTLIGVCVLAFSYSPVFRMFFWILFNLVVIALIHALIFVPAMLSFFPPAPSPKGLESIEKHPNRPTSKKASGKTTSGDSNANSNKISPEEKEEEKAAANADV
jgi:predicted RND superfamily exporter protein